jgi:adenylate kinase
VDYLRDKNVPDLMEYLLQELITTKPASPVQFLREMLSKPITPKILIAGPPAGGKGTQCETIVTTYGVVHISTGDLLRAEVKKGSEIGKKADDCMKNGRLVPDEIIIQMVKNRLKEKDCQEKGWLLDGFPRTKEQAVALQQAGVIPQVMVLLDVPDDVLIERVEGRRTDPVTGKVYHLKFNPPPADEALLKRLEQRKDDTREALKPRLEGYHANLGAILDCYTHIVQRVDGNRDKDATFKDVQRSIEKRQPK